MKLGELEYDVASARISVGDNHTTTIALSGEASKTCLVNISDDIKRVNGHPSRSSISERVEKLLDDISKGM